MASRNQFDLGNFSGFGTSGPSSGHTAFGTVPAPISVAPNIFSQAQSAIPNFGNLTSGTSDLIGSELSGAVSPATMNALKTASAQWGVGSGMPGSGLQNNQLFGNIAGYSEGRQRQGLQDYLATLTGIGHTLTDPGLATEVANRNATMAAAPDPRLAAERQLQEWMIKFNLTRNAGGPSGGTGAFGGRPPDAPSFGGYRGPVDELGFPKTDMSGGAMGNAFNIPTTSALYGPQDTATTQHIPVGAGGVTYGSNLPGAPRLNNPLIDPSVYRGGNNNPDNLFTNNEVMNEWFNPEDFYGWSGYSQNDPNDPANWGAENY